MYWERTKPKLGSTGSKIKLPRVELPKKKQKVEIPRPSFPVKIVYTWALVFLAMSVYTITWFICGIFLFPFINALTASVDFGSQWNSVVDFIKNCFLIHPIISLLGWFIYGIINSFKRDVDTWRQF